MSIFCVMCCCCCCWVSIKKIIKICCCCCLCAGPSEWLEICWADVLDLPSPGFTKSRDLWSRFMRFRTPFSDCSLPKNSSKNGYEFQRVSVIRYRMNHINIISRWDRKSVYLILDTQQATANRYAPDTNSRSGSKYCFHTLQCRGRVWHRDSESEWERERALTFVTLVSLIVFPVRSRIPCISSSCFLAFPLWIFLECP